MVAAESRMVAVPSTCLPPAAAPGRRETAGPRPPGAPLLPVRVIRAVRSGRSATLGRVGGGAGGLGTRAQVRWRPFGGGCSPCGRPGPGTGGCGCHDGRSAEGPWASRCGPQTAHRDEGASLGAVAGCRSPSGAGLGLVGAAWPAASFRTHSQAGTARRTPAAARRRHSGCGTGAVERLTLAVPGHRKGGQHGAGIRAPGGTGCRREPGAAGHGPASAGWSTATARRRAGGMATRHGRGTPEAGRTAPRRQGGGRRGDGGRPDSTRDT